MVVHPHAHTLTGACLGITLSRQQTPFPPEISLSGAVDCIRSQLHMLSQ